MAVAAAISMRPRRQELESGLDAGQRAADHVTRKFRNARERGVRDPAKESMHGRMAWGRGYEGRGGAPAEG